MRSLRRAPKIKHAPRIRSVGRIRIDAAAELLRLEYEKARLAALRGTLAGGLDRAAQDLKTAETRTAWVLDLLGNQSGNSRGPKSARQDLRSAEQRVAWVLDVLGGNPRNPR